VGGVCLEEDERSAVVEEGFGLDADGELLLDTQVLEQSDDGDRVGRGEDDAEHDARLVGPGELVAAPIVG
jgi:hypothetical protein